MSVQVKIFKEGNYFAWGDSVYLTRENNVEVGTGHICGGAADEILTFSIDYCPQADSLRVCAALGADTTFLAEEFGGTFEDEDSESEAL